MLMFTRFSVHECVFVSGEDHFKIYSLDLLLKHIYCSTFPDRNIPVSIATEMLNHCGLDYHPGIACQVSCMGRGMERWI